MADPNPTHVPPIVEALRRFHARFPRGAVRTLLVGTPPNAVVRALVYRSSRDRQPARSALAAWRFFPARTDRLDPTADERVLHAAESRAVCRAIALLLDERAAAPAVPLGAERPAERVSPVQLVRRVAAPDGDRRDEDPYSAPPRRRIAAPPVTPALRERLTDLAALVASAARAGVRPTRVRRWQEQLGAVTDAEPGTLARLDRVERRLRQWVARGELV